MKPTANQVARAATLAAHVGYTYDELDCQAFVEHCVRQAGGRMDYLGTNDLARRAAWLGTLDEARAQGRLVPGAGLLIREATEANLPARYAGDGLGDFSHVGLYVGENALTDTDKNGRRRACDVVHSSATMGRVAGSTLQNGWTHALWFSEIDYAVTAGAGAGGTSAGAGMDVGAEGTNGGGTGAGTGEVTSGTNTGGTSAGTGEVTSGTNADGTGTGAGADTSAGTGTSAGTSGTSGTSTGNTGAGGTITSGASTGTSTGTDAPGTGVTGTTPAPGLTAGAVPAAYATVASPDGGPVKLRKSASRGESLYWLVGAGARVRVERTRDGWSLVTALCTDGYTRRAWMMDAYLRR